MDLRSRGFARERCVERHDEESFAVTGDVVVSDPGD
jgi:hypothetical protein